VIAAPTVLSSLVGFMPDSRSKIYIFVSFFMNCGTQELSSNFFKKKLLPLST